MSILIPGALPAAPIAPLLAGELEKQAPELIALFQQARAETEYLPPSETGCTPEEVCQLRAAGFQPAAGSTWASGLGAWLHQPGDTEPVWLADFAHLALGTDQVGMVPLAELKVSEADDDALFNAAQDALAHLELRAERLTPGRWRLHAPADWLAGARIASPATVARDGLLDWWDHDPAKRPWRRLLNEMQMAWHEHPVNDDRAARGLAPINGLWLYGGAPTWRAVGADDGKAPQGYTVITELQEACDSEDWGRWLQHMRSVAATLTQWRQTASPDETLVLTGRDRVVRLRFVPRPIWQRWRPIPKNEWKNWWQPRD